MPHVRTPLRMVRAFGTATGNAVLKYRMIVADNCHKRFFGFRFLMAMLEVKKSLAFTNGACCTAIACLQAGTLDLPLPQHQSTAGPKSLLC